jgi:hypothetical protein
MEQSLCSALCLRKNFLLQAITYYRLLLSPPSSISILVWTVKLLKYNSIFMYIKVVRYNLKMLLGHRVCNCRPTSIARTFVTYLQTTFHIFSANGLLIIPKLTVISKLWTLKWTELIYIHSFIFHKSWPGYKNHGYGTSHVQISNICTIIVLLSYSCLLQNYVSKLHVFWRFTTMHHFRIICIVLLAIDSIGSRWWCVTLKFTGFLDFVHHQEF